MEILKLIFSIRNVRRAFKVARVTRLERIIKQDLITTQAAAYGFEIGRGKPMREMVEASLDNPFRDSNWRNKVIDNDV